jgi:pimeloyl-ACP methyl ester carboxylesterase
MSLRASAGYPPGADYDVDEARQLLGAITARVLVVVAEHDALTGASVAEHFVDALQDARVTVIPGAGHFPWVDAPDAFRSAVTSFLDA